MPEVGVQDRDDPRCHDRDERRDHGDPEAELVFTVTHEAGLSLRDAITALPGFDARVTGESDGGIDVTAHDPDGD